VQIDHQIESDVEWMQTFAAEDTCSNTSKSDCDSTVGNSVRGNDRSATRSNQLSVRNGFACDLTCSQPWRPNKVSEDRSRNDEQLVVRVSDTLPTQNITFVLGMPATEPLVSVLRFQSSNIILCRKSLEAQALNFPNHAIRARSRHIRTSRTCRNAQQYLRNELLRDKRVIRLV